uniref:Uncharacterized protein n=1 Tax=Meloidogyne javanica TaxID=6303 RepID=A0A915MAL3_MELJA
MEEEIEDKQQQQNSQDNDEEDICFNTPPLICEQGPSAPSSPTTSSPGARSAKRPCPLSVDALQRINLLSPNYVPPPISCYSLSGTQSMMDSSSSKIPPPSSPSYPTSDLGSSPRSSISTCHYSTLGISAANWSVFRDIAYSCGGGSLRSTGIDDETSEGGNNLNNEDKADTHRFLLSPQLLLSPLLSPFSDCGVADLHIGYSASATPYSRSPNMSPSPIRRMRGSVGGGGDLTHFSFEQIRSRSSLSNHASNNAQEAFNNSINNSSEPPNYHQRMLATANAISQPRSLDLDARERSRSEGEALSSNNLDNGRRKQVEEWIKQQTVALEAIRHSL